MEILLTPPPPLKYISLERKVAVLVFTLSV